VTDDFDVEYVDEEGTRPTWPSVKTAASFRPPRMPSDVGQYPDGRQPAWRRLAIVAALCVPWTLVGACLGTMALPPRLGPTDAAPYPVVYVPRCAPAFAGRALVCTDGPRAITVKVLAP
jgi:hypothetical protein